MGKINTKTYKTKNGIDFAVRTALPKDAEKVLRFTETVLNEAPYLLFSPGEFQVSLEQQREYLEKIYDNSNNLAIIAEYDGEVIGFLDFKNGNRRRIKHQGSFGMSVAEQFRSQGIGKSLLASLIDWAANNSTIEKINLEVFAENSNAIKLYRSFGFEDEGLKRMAIKLDEHTYSDLMLMTIFV